MNNAGRAGEQKNEGNYKILTKGRKEVGDLVRKVKKLNFYLTFCSPRESLMAKDVADGKGDGNVSQFSNFNAQPRVTA